MHWANPNFRLIGAAVLIGLVLAFALDYTRRKRALERIGHVPQLARMTASVSSARRGLKAFLTVLGVSLVAFALAGPQVEGESEWRQRGIDVALVLDFSKSMLARDVYPSRGERMKHEADLLLDAFAGDRIALVAFAGGAIHYPLTSDYQAAKLLYGALDPRDMPPGSDVGEAILTARCLLRPDVTDAGCERTGSRGAGGDPLDAPPRSERTEAPLDDRARAIVIFSDGGDTEGHAREEVERAAQLGIQVFVVGVGTREGDQIPEFDREGNQIGWKRTADGKSYLRTKLEEGALKDLAIAGGGADHYFRDDPRRIGIDGLIKALGELKEGDLSTRVVTHRKEAYQWLLFPGFLALLIEACLSDRRRERRQKVEVRA